MAEKRILKKGRCPGCKSRIVIPGTWKCGTSTDVKGNIVRTPRCHHYERCGMAGLVAGAENAALGLITFSNSISDEAPTQEKAMDIATSFLRKANEMLEAQKKK